MHLTTRTVAAAAAGSLLLAGLAPAASAAPLVRDQFEYTESFVDDDFCEAGFPVLIEFMGTVRTVAVSRGRDRLAYFVDRVKEEVTFTTLDEAGDPVPGLTAREVNTVLSKDHRVVDNGDGTLTIQVLATGNSVQYGPDGKAVGRNPGQVRFSVLIDHGGTPGDPEDDEFLDFLGLDFGSTGRNDDFCEVMLPVLAP